MSPNDSLVPGVSNRAGECLPATEPAGDSNGAVLEPNVAAAPDGAPVDEAAPGLAGWTTPGGARRRPGGRGRRLVRAADQPAPLTPEQRLLLLDTWQRSGLPAGDFAALVGLSKHTLYAWKKKFDSEGPAGLMDQPRGRAPGSRLPDLTRRTILMLKQANPNWGCQRISDMLARG